MSGVLCTGDWHVGATLNYGPTPAERLDEQEQAIDRIIDVALERDVDLVLIGGDFWHRRRPTSAEAFAVARPLRRLHREGNCDIVAIAGNHDVENATWPTFVELFGDIMDVHRTPAVVETRACAVATLPWTPVSALVASANGGDRGDIYRLAADLLVETARGLRAEIRDGRPAILLGHWSVSGATTPTGMLADLFNEAVLPLPEIEDLGFDAVVLSHIHNGQMLAPDPQPIFYTSSPFTVDFGEADTKHGVWILDVDGDGVRPEFVEIPSRPFVTIDENLGDHDAFGLSCVWSSADVNGAYVRVRLTGTEQEHRGLVDRTQIERALYDAGAHKVVSITPDIVRAERARADASIEDLSPVETVRLWVSAQEFERAEEIVAAAEPYLE